MITGDVLEKKLQHVENDLRKAIMNEDAKSTSYHLGRKATLEDLLDEYVKEDS